MTGVFHEVVRLERLVFTSTPLDEAGNPLFEILTTVTFDEEGGKTKLTLEARVVSATAGADQYLDGMEEGWNQSLDRLTEELAT
jgi:uncharacterized protein YndB with AHSA1/START domain